MRATNRPGQNAGKFASQGLLEQQILTWRSGRSGFVWVKEAHVEGDEFDAVPDGILRLADHRPMVRHQPDFEFWEVGKKLFEEKPRRNGILAGQGLHQRHIKTGAFGGFRGGDKANTAQGGKL